MIRYTTATTDQARDLFGALSKDPNFVNLQTPFSCSTTPPKATDVTLCFFL